MISKFVKKAQLSLTKSTLIPFFKSPKALPLLIQIQKVYIGCNNYRHR